MDVRSMFDLTGEKAIVTGGGEGLGKEMALALAEAGADVAVPDINFGGAKKVANEIRKLSRRSIATKTDGSKIDEVEERAHSMVYPERSNLVECFTGQC